MHVPYTSTGTSLGLWTLSHRLFNHIVNYTIGRKSQRNLNRRNIRISIQGSEFGNILSRPQWTASQSPAPNYSRATHYNDVIMSKIASQITSLTIVYWTVYSGPDQTKHQISASPAFVPGNHRGPVNSPHKWPVTRKMFPFEDVIIASSAKVHEFFRKFWQWYAVTVLLSCPIIFNIIIPRSYEDTRGFDLIITSVKYFLM